MDENQVPITHPNFEPSEEPLTNERIEELFSQIDGATILINDFCANSESKLSVAGVTMADIKERISRACLYIERAQNNDWYKDESRDKSSYDDAIDTGNTFVEN